MMEVLPAHLPKHNVQDPKLDGTPHFRYDQGHIVQVQPRAACNASHMSKGSSVQLRELSDLFLGLKVSS